MKKFCDFVIIDSSQSPRIPEINDGECSDNANKLVEEPQVFNIENKDFEVIKVINWPL